MEKDIPCKQMKTKREQRGMCACMCACGHVHACHVCMTQTKSKTVTGQRSSYNNKKVNSSRDYESPKYTCILQQKS